MASPEAKRLSGLSRVVVALVMVAAAWWVGSRYVWTRPGLVEVVAVAPVTPFVAQPAGPPVVVSALAPAAALGLASSGTPSPSLAPVAGSKGPSFDIVRVGPQGNAVIAGRAAPGAEVIVRDGAAEVARTRADRQGSFVAIPAAPLAAGGRELTLASRGADGVEVQGDGTVLLDVPRAPVAMASSASAAVAPVVALLVPGVGAPRVLQDTATTASAIGVSVTLDTVDYDDAGAIRFTGRAAAGGALRLYIDNGAAGDARANGVGRWTVTPTIAVAAGVHMLRVDHLGADGRVVARVELPFQRAVVQAAEVAGGHVVVQPGQSLWRLARLAYGRGVQYRVIYLANREQIRDPRLIYPGQTFAVPTP